MDAPDAFFVPDGSVFAATELTRGPWSRDLQHGGPPAALLARAIEALAGPEALVARFAVEFWRPIPIVPLAVAATVVRAGRKVQVVQARLAIGRGGEAKECARATAVCIRRTPVELPPRAPPYGEDLPAPPEQCPPFEFPFFSDTVGYHRAIEIRLARGEFGRGSMAAWMRMRGALVAGEAPSPLQRVVVVADSGNGVSAGLDVSRYVFVNPDLTVCLHRPLEGEWVCLDARTTADPGGVGLADTALFDPLGPIGRSLQTLVVERRDGPR